ncbi:hypothetical protein MRX62_13745 (plasmid) [Xylella fastidiosa subsp. pauca]
MTAALSSAYAMHEGDALRLLCDIDSASVDAVITDPPYCSGAMRMSDRFKPTQKIYQQRHETRCPDFDCDFRDHRGFWRGPANGFRSVAALRGLGACF